MHISPIDFYLRSRIGGRASLFSFFFFFLLYFLGYQYLHRELGHQLFFFKPHHGQILGGYSDCIYSMERFTYKRFWLWLKKRTQQCNPTSAKTETQATLFSLPCSFSFFFPSFFSFLPIFLVGSLREQGSGGWFQ
ncbi:hypothetical protein L209DRAFT_235384 [Thermothelomyces heterothallicus CBS 203.75]